MLFETKNYYGLLLLLYYVLCLIKKQEKCWLAFKIIILNNKPQVLFKIHVGILLLHLILVYNYLKKQLLRLSLKMFTFTASTLN